MPGYLTVEFPFARGFQNPPFGRALSTSTNLYESAPRVKDISRWELPPFPLTHLGRPILIPGKRPLETLLMLQDHRIAVVIPCFRVEHKIEGVLRSLPEYVDLAIAVNDASPDDTGAILDRLAAAGLEKGPELKVLHHEKNQGVGGAMASGFREALRQKADVVVKLDGDGQMRPEDMVTLLQPILANDCDYAKGNRFLHFDSLRKMPLARKLGSIALTFFTKISSGYWHVFDPQNGYLAIHRDFLKLLNLDRLASRRYFFENELLIQMNIQAARVQDCPMPSVYGDEISSLSIGKVLLYFPFFLVRGFVSRLFHRYVLRDFSVVVPLYLMGSLLFGWGFLFGLRIWYNTVTAEVAKATPTGTIMLSVLPLILGVQFLMQGLLIEIMQTPKSDRGYRRPVGSNGGSSYGPPPK